ncbi:hypothetical protein [Psychroflexus planctonicus]|uniref:ATP synthase protein I n=1 Tax=Psychroflexus planctonicus TaxID=1526575 RepID=A0ABQ1SE76_9FLAO|nr:hypothetical protein [Psychroflexus planctonicus]GGE25298.1 hypothetical protein GCM10010832_02530 [Psychroflexus planctonicus]
MSKPILHPFKFILAYLLLMLILFVPHFLLEEVENNSIMYWSYAFNSIITLLYLIIVSLFSESFKHQIGFVFLGVATFKIILFLTIQYVTDFKIEAHQFLVFFIPYFSSLVFEIFVTKKILDHISFKE